jgi:hypothetical protein
MMQFLLVAPLLFAVPDPAPPARPTVQDAVGKVPWFTGTLEAAVAEGKTKQRIVLAFYWADQNPACLNMGQSTFSDDRVVTALANVLCVRVDVRAMTPLASRVPIRHVPVFVWFSPDGKPRDRMDGFWAPDPFLAETARIVNDVGTINDMRRKLANRQDDVDAHFELFLKLRAAGDMEGMNEERAAILRLDPEGHSRARMRFRYEDITNAIEQHWAQKRELPMDKVADLRTFVEVTDDPEVLWDGWMRLANTHAFLEQQPSTQPESAKQHRATRRDCLARAWRGITQNPDFLRDWCFQYAELFWVQRDELSEADKSFFLAMTMRMIKVFEREAEAYGYRARALMLAGQREDAIAAAERAIEFAPNDPKYQQLVRAIRGS